MNTVAGLVGRRQPIVRMSAVLGLLLAVMAPGEGVSAQRLSGRLLDLFSNVPLGSGVLTVRTADQRVVQSALSDEGGHWSFELPGPGVYYVEAARMGYEAWLAGPVEVTAEDDLTFVYHLRPQPIQLDPIEVTVAATRRHLETAGFYDRQRADFGTFLGPDEIEKRRSAPRFTDLLFESVNIGYDDAIGVCQYEVRLDDLDKNYFCGKAPGQLFDLWQYGFRAL